MFKKIGECIEISPANIQAAETVVPNISAEILAEMTKFASGLKRIAPKAEDFLYFSSVIMHAAEASLINEDGTPKLTRTGEIVEGGWNKTGGTWKWQTNDPSIKPYKNCFLPGTEVLMEDGSCKFIEDVEPGDKVITHKGRSKEVLKKFITPHSGKVIKLKAQNNQSLTCTDNHPIYHADLTGFLSKGLGALTTQKENDEGFRTSFKMSPASELTVGDLLLSPVLHDIVDSNLNPNRARLLGIYAAEGSFSKKYDKRQAVRFTIGITETKQAELIKSAFKEEFPECSVKVNPEPSRSIIEITASGHNIADYFYYHCGEYSHTKKLSKELVFASDDIKKSFLAGWIDGDGCLSTNDHNKLIVITTSPHLAYQTRTMMNAMRIGNSLRKINSSRSVMISTTTGKEYARKDHYRLELYGDAYKKLDLDKLTVKYAFQNYNHRIFSNFESDYCLHQLKKIEESTYIGNVYNIEVAEDHSYVANGLVVSNCNGDIFPAEELIKAHKKWVGKPLCIDHKSSSVDHVRGFIVDTYYDHLLKRVIALCALDKHNYPDLARKVSTGYSNSVSMGTAVGKAICYDCGTIARTEHDFCQHMRTHSCYGEINVDLNPIELSIVVNGADPNAKIKHIIAAANTLNSYVESKEQEIKKLADLQFTAQLNFSDPHSNEMGTKSGEVVLKADSLAQLKQEIDEALVKFQTIISEASEENSQKDATQTAFNQSSGTFAMQESDLPGTNFQIGPPAPIYQMAELEKELLVIKTSMEDKIARIQQDLDKLLVTTFNTKEEIMSGKNDNMNKQGYFQGGGGLNEPTPGERKYPVDPAQDDLREHADKQMVGQKPFPDVGPVDGMYPGYESFPTGELERKKMLARADVEERRIRRLAVINKAKDALETSRKDAYFNNGLDAKNPNTPTPHVRKYPVDPMQDDLREHDDKQMVGQKPFPDVGAVDGLHPSPLSAKEKDELKRKKELQRAAGIRVKFSPVKTANGSPDFAKSTWEVFNDDQLILTKSVDEITGGGSRSEALYSTIASESFAKDLISKIKTVGADKVSGLFKSSQMTSPAPQGDAPQTPAMGDSAGPADDSGKDGDPKDVLVETADKVRDLASDLAEQAKALTGEKAQMGEMDGLELPPAAAEDGQVTVASLLTMKKAIIDPLLAETNDAIASLNACEAELTSLAELYGKGAVTAANRDFVNDLAANALADTKEAMTEAFGYLGAFVQFAEANVAVEKRAMQEAKLNKQAHDGEHMKPENKEIMGLLEESGEHLADDSSAESSESKADDMLAAMLADDLALASVDSNDAIVTSDPAMAAEIAQKNPSADVEVKHASLETKAERLVQRAKLASEMKWNPIFREFHPKDKALPGHLDTKPSDNLEVVENLEEKHDRMMDVATAPPSVRKEAANIQEAIVSGHLKVADVDSLVAHGVDPEAVKYWKSFYGEIGPEGKEFANELVKEHAKAQVEEEMSNYRVKIARAYELAYEMVDRELLPRSKDAITQQVNEVMKWNDQGFESMKKVIARQAPAFQKSAGRMPQVGVYGQEDAAPVKSAKSDQEMLTDLFSRSNPKRSF